MTSRQETRSGRRWILVALLVFLLCLVLWIVAALILNIAFAESLPFSLGLRSRLAANYAPDEFVGSLGVFRLSIIDEILLDRGIQAIKRIEADCFVASLLTMTGPERHCYPAKGGIRMTKWA